MERLGGETAGGREITIRMVFLMTESGLATVLKGRATMHSGVHVP